jgi:hypothetical protein
MKNAAITKEDGNNKTINILQKTKTKQKNKNQYIMSNKT